jgi:hypothetical protein
LTHRYHEGNDDDEEERQRREGDTNADGCFLNAAGDFLTVTIPVSATYPTGLTVGTTAPDNVAVVHFRVSVN